MIEKALTFSWKTRCGCLSYWTFINKGQGLVKKCEVRSPLKTDNILTIHW